MTRLQFFQTWLTQIFGVGAAAQTQVGTDQIKSQAGAPHLLGFDATGKATRFNLGEGFNISGGVINAKRLNFISLTASSDIQKWAIPPGSNVLAVWRNGLLQLSPADYTIAGNEVTFTATMNTDDLVQILNEN